jgi:flagellar motor component MotA
MSVFIIIIGQNATYFVAKELQNVHKSSDLFLIALSSSRKMYLNRQITIVRLADPVV